ncbi:hypothetical protein HDU93_003005 [Gonapodya sp. JEL0774]|nr:hypothetical protein HDU93_003005 [Gonapodya sp. JEL0774]
MEGAGFFGGGGGANQGDGGGSFPSVPSFPVHHRRDRWDHNNSGSRESVLIPGAITGAAAAWWLWGGRRQGYQPIPSTASPLDQSNVSPPQVLIFGSARARNWSPRRSIACCLSCTCIFLAVVILLALSVIFPLSHSEKLTLVAGDRVLIDPGRDMVTTLGYEFLVDDGVQIFVFDSSIPTLGGFVSSTTMAVVPDRLDSALESVVYQSSHQIPSLNFTLPLTKTIEISLPEGGSYRYLRFDLYRGSTWQVEWDMTDWNIPPVFIGLSSSSSFDLFTSTGQPPSDALHRRQAAKGSWTGKAGSRSEYYFVWYTASPLAYAHSGNASVHISAVTYSTAGATAVCRGSSVDHRSDISDIVQSPYSGMPFQTRQIPVISCDPYSFFDKPVGSVSFLAVAPPPGTHGYTMPDSFSLRCCDLEELEIAQREGPAAPTPTCGAEALAPTLDRTAGAGFEVGHGALDAIGGAPPSYEEVVGRYGAVASR